MLSLSVLIGIVFYTPLLLCVAGPFALLCAIAFLIEKTIGTCDLERRGSIVRLTLETLKSALAWASKETFGYGVDEEENRNMKKSEGLAVGIMAMVFLMLIAPLIIYSTWTMMFIYAGSSTSGVMDFIALTYKHCIGVFLGLEFQLPSLSFSLGSAIGAMRAYSDFTRFASFDPSHFLESSLGLTALSFLVSLIKPLICLIAGGFLFFGFAASQVANLPVVVVAEKKYLRGIMQFITTEQEMIANKEVEMEAEIAEKKLAKRGSRPSAAAADRGIEVDVATADP